MSRIEEDVLAEDRRARSLIRTQLDRCFIVEAAAGTGKTTELIARLVAVLRNGVTTVDRIAAVTFTRKAAGELKLRLRQELDSARAGIEVSSEERVSLEHAISHLEEARVGTIHSFCAEILRQRPVEARVDPAFEELTEDQAKAMFDSVLRRFLEEKLESLPEGLLRLSRRPPEGRNPENLTLIDRISEAAWSLAEWRDFPAPWRRDPFEREPRIRALIERAKQLAGYVRRIPQKSPLVTWLGSIADFSAWLSRHEEVASDLDVLEAKLVELSRQVPPQKTGRAKEAAPGLPTEKVVSEARSFLDELSLFCRDAAADLAALLHDELLEVVGRYQDEKRRTGRVDFVDLLVLTRDLVRDHPETRKHLSERISHLFVDEFQDTDPLQVEILLLLAADDIEEKDWRKSRPIPGKLFVVGDPKQSIYRFRRADLELYHEVKSALIERGVTHVKLTRSFRGTHPLQSLVNAAFERRMRADARVGQAAYVPLAGGPAAHLPTSAVVLPIGKPFGYKGDVTVAQFNSELPRTVASFVEWLVSESGWQVRDPADPAQLVPVLPRHVCLLFSRFMNFGNDFTREFVRELELRGISHLLVGSRSFHRREEVETLRAAATAIEWPEDDLAIYATLRGALFALPDDLLFVYQRVCGSLDPFRPRPTDRPDLEDVSRALDVLSALHRKRNFRSVAETLSELLEITRAHAGFALRPAGDQVLANVLRVIDLARSYEAQGGLSFRGFVEMLSAEAERVRTVESPVIEDGVEGVRLMTVHSAKGLEFPVVVLVDAANAVARDRPTRSVDTRAGRCVQRLVDLTPIELSEAASVEVARDGAESLRLAYVASTRAKDLLVLPWVGVEFDRSSWVRPLVDVLMPESGEWDDGASVPGVPRFGDESILAWPQAPGRSVRPGAYRLGEVETVWWDPELLARSPEDSVGLEHVELLVSKGNELAAQEASDEYTRFLEERSEDLARGHEPSARPFNPTHTELDPPRYSPRVEIVTLPIKKHRPGGRRFGTLVHTILAHSQLDADREEISRLAYVHGAALGATADEVRSSVDPVMTALSHSLFERARSAEEVRREWPFVLDVSELELAEGDLLEGSIDLAFLESGVWHVIDYKTDPSLDEALGEYRRQVRWYMYAVSKMSGHSANGWILRV
ncbi:MAG: UvrD-helicase domain-containing protein [Deltaproteobacteria bacterium]|nr:UvrD-helicase domain-containing protein [Deltaproteobacteria bacterium]